MSKLSLTNARYYANAQVIPWRGGVEDSEGYEVSQGVGLIVFPQQSVAWHANRTTSRRGNPHWQTNPFYLLRSCYKYSLTVH